MEVKEAIEFCKSELYFDLKNFLPDYQLEYNNKMREIIELLQQGEKYRQMWDRLEHGVVYADEGNYTYSWSEKLIGHMHRIKRILEQKYFPKEAKTNGS